jgi:subtilisin family serine protease
LRRPPLGWENVRFVVLVLGLLAGVGLVCPEDMGQARAVGQAMLPHARPPRVAVIDSGIAQTPELRSAVSTEFDMAAKPARPAFQPREHHGTMVATVLLRSARRPIEIISLRIDDPAGCPAGLAPPCQSQAAPVAAAIRKATDLGVSAINISLTLKDDLTIIDALRDAAAHGIAIVLAAGNEGRDSPSNLRAAEAAYPHAILVGALGPDGKAWAGSNRPQTNTSGYLYTWQRGVAVPTVLADGTKVLATGTSFAAPVETAHVLNRSRALPVQR